MLTYLILLLLFLVGLFIERGISRRTAVAYLWGIGMLALAVSGFRDMIGGYDVYIYGEV
ncbi:MAG: EpsG family protein, partial [Chryseobacterium sp.]